MADVLNGSPVRPGTDQSTSELVQKASEQITRLVRDEIALAKAELTEKGKHAGIGVGLFGGGGVLALYGVGALLATLIIVLDLFHVGLWGTLVPLWFYICATGFMFPCVQVLSLANHGAQAGTAASLLGASQFMMAGIVPPVVGWLGVNSAVPMGAVMAVCIAGSMTALWLVVRPRTVPSIH